MNVPDPVGSAGNGEEYRLEIPQNGNNQRDETLPANAANGSVDEVQDADVVAIGGPQVRS